MNALTFLNIAAEYRQDVARLADLQDDEQALADTIESLQWPLAVKAENTMFVMRDTQFKLQALDSEIERLSQVRERFAKKETDLLNYLHLCLSVAGVTELTAGTFKLKMQQAARSVEILDARQIPAEYMRQPATPPTPAPAPDKNAIAAAIKIGKEIPGAKLSDPRLKLVIK